MQFFQTLGYYLQICKKNIKCGMTLLKDDINATRKVKTEFKQPKASMKYVPKDVGKAVVVGLAQDAKCDIYLLD